MWNVYTLVLHPHSWKARRFVPMGFVLYLAALAAVAVIHHRWLGIAALPLAAYVGLLMACSAGSRAASAGRARVAATFLAYHLAYGSGPFVGIFNMVTGRWRSQLGRPIDDEGGRAAPDALPSAP